MAGHTCLVEQRFTLVLGEDRRGTQEPEEQKGYRTSSRHQGLAFAPVTWMHLKNSAVRITVRAMPLRAVGAHPTREL